MHIPSLAKRWTPVCLLALVPLALAACSGNGGEGGGQPPRSATEKAVDQAAATAEGHLKETLDKAKALQAAGGNRLDDMGQAVRDQQQADR